MEDEKRRKRLLWIAMIIAALAVIGATSIIFDSTLTFGRIVCSCCSSPLFCWSLPSS